MLFFKIDLSRTLVYKIPAICDRCPGTFLISLPSQRVLYFRRSLTKADFGENSTHLEDRIKQFVGKYEPKTNVFWIDAKNDSFLMTRLESLRFRAEKCVL